MSIQVRFCCQKRIGSQLFNLEKKKSKQKLSFQFFVDSRLKDGGL